MQLHLYSCKLLNPFKDIFRVHIFLNSTIIPIFDIIGTTQLTQPSLSFFSNMFLRANCILNSKGWGVNV